ncbi:GNAT family N-acetyltransferase [Lysinibacillus sphaericus]
MSSSPLVKQYTSQYQTQVADLILHIQKQEYSIPITKKDQPDLFMIEEYYQTGRGNFWIAVYNDHVVGTISLLDIGNNQAALRKMFVDKEFRGAAHKTASLLLAAAMRWAEERSIHPVYLGTTPQFLAAHRFYEKTGFKRIEREDLPENFPVLQVDKKFYRYSLS